MTGPDRERLIEAVLYELGSEPGDYRQIRAREERWAGRIVDAVLAALPAEPVRATDPIRAAAEDLIATADRLPWDFCPDQINTLRAALAADRESKPVEITDEMVERAARALWRKSSTYPYERLIQVTVEDLRDYARQALIAALSEPPPEGESDG